jgi:hypothetical protein
MTIMLASINKLLLRKKRPLVSLSKTNVRKAATFIA